MNKEKQRSNLEIHFEWYLAELVAAGYVTEWMSQLPGWMLFVKAEYVYTKQLKTKRKEIKAVIPGLSKMEYTPDFRIVWTPEAKGIFWQNFYSGRKLKSPFFIENEFILEAYVEIKPGFDQHNMTRTVQPKIRWVWEKFGSYVQIITPEKLFEQTFTPARYLFCDKIATRKRKIKYPVRTLRDYLKEEIP
ncbi:MAG TPA: hypothetical protein ENH82_02265 [bacterium]|nr:hypothetical protein [bacterium]